MLIMLFSMLLTVMAGFLIFASHIGLSIPYGIAHVPRTVVYVLIGVNVFTMMFLGFFFIFLEELEGWVFFFSS